MLLMLIDGGARRVFVMPNLQPPITTAKMANEYKASLEKLAPDVEFRMSLYLGTITFFKKKQK